MKKSIIMFIGGSLFGVIAALIVVNQTTTKPPVSTTKTNSKIQTAQMQAEQMENSEEPAESLSDMQMRLSQQPGTQSMADMQSDNSEINENQPIEAIPSDNSRQEQIKAVMAIPPTAVQIEQYNEIEKIIRSATNNPKVKLNDLLRKSDNLTIQQRSQLTQKAMEMLKSGQLTIDQFAAAQPES